jgi:hypothetical protein
MTSAESSGTGGSAGTDGGNGGVTITNNGCALPPSGIFLVHYDGKQAATCGVFPDSLVDGQDVQNTNTCMSGRGRISDTPIAGGGCTVVVNVTGCQVAGHPGSVDLIGQVTWSADYSSAVGIESFDAKTPTGSCTGTYNVTWTKQ